ncbi:MAG: hypothetical protein ACOZIN_13040 [Myxococcota bacterium]
MRALLLGMVTLSALAGCKKKESLQLAEAAKERAKDAGSGVAPVPAHAHLIASGQNVPRDLYAAGDSLHWLNEGRRAEGKPGLFKVSKRGGEVAELAVGLGIHAHALDGENVYWIHPENEVVMRAPLAGGAPTPIASGQENLSALALDDTHVYWAGAEEIRRAPKAGGPVQVVASKLSIPSGLSVDAQAVYWYSPMSGKLARAPKKGGAARPVLSENVTLHSFFLDDGFLYWSLGSEKKAVIRRQATSGGKPFDVVTGQDVPAGLTADATHVYWTTGDAIFRVPKEGGAAAQTVVDGTDRALSVAVDETHVYWSDRMGRIQSVPK